MRIGGYALVSTGFVHFGARAAITAAIALAPNASAAPTKVTTALPDLLATHVTSALQTQVGPPAATVASWLVEPIHAFKGTIVLLHGIRLDKSSLIPLAAALSDAGYRALLVDLRGHGESTGRYLTYGSLEARDVSQVLDGLEARGVSLGCVGAFGFSYGGAVAIELGARDKRVRAVVAAAAFSSLREVVGDYRQKYLPAALGFVPDSWFQDALDDAGRLAAFDPDEAAPSRAAALSAARLLLFHGSDDTQVPLRHARRLAVAAGQRATLDVIPGADHAAILADPSGRIQRETVAWFERWL